MEEKQEQSVELDLEKFKCETIENISTEDSTLFDFSKEESLLDTTNLKIEIDSLLIGKFSANGSYKIQEPILKELVAVNKVIEERFGNNYILVSKHALADELSLKFSLTFSKDADKRKASLYILEKIYIDGSFANIKSTLIATYTDLNDETFGGKVKKVFNIKQKPTGDGVEFMDENLVILFLKTKNELLSAKKNLLSGAEAIDEKFFKALIELLKKSGKYGEFIIQNFLDSKKSLNVSEKNIGKDYYQKLTKCLIGEMQKAGETKMPKELQESYRKLAKERQIEYSDLSKKKVLTIDNSKKAPIITKSAGGGGGKSKSSEKGKSSSKSGNSAKQDKKAKAYGPPLNLEQEEGKSATFVVKKVKEKQKRPNKTSLFDEAIDEEKHQLNQKADRIGRFL